MADQLNMSGLNLGPAGGEQQAAPTRSYIPPHMRGKMGMPNGNPNVPVNGPGPGMNGLNNSAWAG